MAKANPSAEPSMEEILASIRRIISDDGEATPSQPAAAANDPEPDAGESQVTEDDLDRLFASGASEDEDEADAVGEADVLELDETMAAVVDEGPEIVEGLRPDESDVTFADDVPEIVDENGGLDWEEPEPEAPPPPPPPRAESRRPDPEPAPEDEEPLVSPQTGASVNAAFGQLTHTILSANARTLDDLVKEMLRPMLKAWLDENLPAVVERLVRAEIERVSRGR